MKYMICDDPRPPGPTGAFDSGPMIPVMDSVGSEALPFVMARASYCSVEHLKVSWVGYADVKKLKTQGL